MANFFSKYFSELVLMATAMLWAGCGNVDKDSKNEKSLSRASDRFGVAEISNPVESSDSAALPHASEKDDYFANVFSNDSFMADIERLLKHACDYGACARRYPSFENSSAIENSYFRTLKVFYKNIEFANTQTLNQAMFSRVERVFRQKSLVLRQLYGKYFKNDSVNAFEGEIILKLTIAADGTVEESSIKKSTTGVDNFDEEIRTVVSRWTFSKVKSGMTVVYVPIRFFRDDKTSSQPK